MKWIALIVLLSSPALATSYTVTLPDAVDPWLEAYRVRNNVGECQRLLLPDACTFAQAQAADPATSYLPTIASVLRFLGVQLATIERNQKKRRDAQAWCQEWEASTQSQRDAKCVALGKAAGCDLCP